MRAIPTASGDRLEIGTSGRFDGGARTVRVKVGDVDLQPDEARRFAVVLIEHAAEAEHRGRKQRSG